MKEKEFLFSERVVNKTDAILNHHRWEKCRIEILNNTDLDGVYTDGVTMDYPKANDEDFFNDNVQYALEIIEKYYENLQ